MLNLKKITYFEFFRKKSNGLTLEYKGRDIELMIIQIFSIFLYFDSINAIHLLV